MKSKTKREYQSNDALSYILFFCSKKIIYLKGGKEMTVNNEDIFIGFHISDFGIISVPDIANPKMVRIINNGTARFAAFDKEAVVFIDMDLDEDSEKIFTSYFQKVAFTQFRNT